MLALDRARAGHDHDLVAADLHAAGVDDGLLAPKVRLDSLYGSLTRTTSCTPSISSNSRGSIVVDVADHAEDGLFGAGGTVDVEAARASAPR